MRAMVTGGLGFIGSCLVQKLLDREFSVIIVDNKAHPSPMSEKFASSDKVVFESGCVSDIDPEKWKRSVDIIYHLASPVGPVGVLGFSGRMASGMLSGIERMAQLASLSDARLVFVSTSEAYGPAGSGGTQRESDACIVPTNVTVRLEYGVGKLISEIALKNISREADIDFVITRLFNTSGPGQDHKYGFVVPRFSIQAIGNKPITVFGDGTKVRCFAHVSDVADGIIAAGKRGRSGETYNLGNPWNILSIRRLAEMVKSRAESDSEIVYQDPKQTVDKNYSEAWNKVPSIEKAMEELSWTPTMSLEQIIDDVREYVKVYKR